ncbi:MAG: pyridoxamine 5'-phosphate oxidase [Okeania sp. SIO2H7]|nr:pyridoxamine 5'-phosphate oxidase [Okeania sp. SIO2H7]
MISEDLAPWRSPLARALHRNDSLPHSRYFQLATVAEGGFPANRTVVFRGFLEGTNRLKIITDSRSEKIQQIEKNPLAEACWYFTKTREQFRLAGELTAITAEDFNTKLGQIRASVWQEISDSARQQFAWPPPGQKRGEATAFELASPDKIEPLPNFCLLLLEPVKVEHLELRGEPQNRWLYQREAKGFWSTLAINP